MTEKKRKKKYLPCMYDHSIDCTPEYCIGHHKEEIELPIIDVKGGKITTHCLVLAVKATRIEEMDVFGRNFINTARSIAKAMSREGQSNE